MMIMETNLPLESQAVHKQEARRTPRDMALLRRMDRIPMNQLSAGQPNRGSERRRASLPRSAYFSLAGLLAPFFPPAMRRVPTTKPTPKNP